MRGAQHAHEAGEHLEQSLLALHQRLTSEAPPSLVLETEEHLEAELQTWGDEAARFYQATSEISMPWVDGLSSG